jgi:hypothetical protein
MINQQLIQELKIILKEEFELDLPDQEVEVVGNQLVSSYETLIKLYISKEEKIC